MLILICYVYQDDDTHYTTYGYSFLFPGGRALTGLYTVEFFDEGYFTGNKDTYLNSSEAVRVDNTMSSFTVTPGWCVILYKDYFYRGDNKTICSSNTTSTELGADWNNVVSSFKVEGNLSCTFKHVH